MTRSEKLRPSRKAYTVAWREFILHVKKAPKTVFCFFEGEDNRYFIGRIEPYLADDAAMKPLDCGGNAFRRIIRLL